MMKYLLFSLMFLFSQVLGAQNTNSDTLKQGKTVFVFSIDEEIAPAMWRHTQQSFERAKEEEADMVLIKLNTYGGMVNMADSIRSKILESPKPVYVFIENNAASAGALISIAADTIFMRPGSRIGSASVVNQQGEIMPEKYQSYMRSTMRSTAEAHGKDTLITGNDTLVQWHRDPLIAEAMVDPSIVVPGIVDSTKIVAFTAQEAMQHGYCEAIVNSVPELMEWLQVDEYVIKEYEPSGLEKVIRFLVNPALQGILIMIIVGGIYFELQQPGIGFALAASLIAALLYFAPLYLEGLAAHWELGIFIIGLLLIAVEIFVIPGFGIAGVSGILLTIAGLVLAMVDNVVFEFEFHALEAVKIVLSSLVLVTVSSLAALIGSIYLSKKILTSQQFSSLILGDTQQKDDGYIGVDTIVKTLKGRIGIAETVLRPGGKVRIDETIFDARSETGFVEKGEKVKVIRDGTYQIYVLKVKEEDTHE
ncbi:MAG: NfeD family protein [Bacteroidota bacterium]